MKVNDLQTTFVSTTITSNTRPHTVDYTSINRDGQPEGTCRHCGEVGEINALVDLPANAIGCTPVPKF